MKPVPQALTRDEYRDLAYKLLGYHDLTYGSPCQTFPQLLQQVAVNLFMSAGFGQRVLETETRRRLKQLLETGCTDE